MRCASRQWESQIALHEAIVTVKAALREASIELASETLALQATRSLRSALVAASGRSEATATNGRTTR